MGTCTKGAVTFRHQHTPTLVLVKMDTGAKGAVTFR